MNKNCHGGSIHRGQASCNGGKDEEGIHLHCQTCYTQYCHVHPNCQIIYCEHRCGLMLHQCKQHDHSLICPSVSEPCINAQFGCPFVLPREQMRKHLEHCPSSVIYCTMEWNRYPVFSKACEPSVVYFATSVSKYPILNKYEQRTMREHWVPFFQRNPVKVQGDLDTELALHDQSKLERVQREKMKRGWLNAQSQKKSSKRQVARLHPERIQSIDILLAPSQNSRAKARDPPPSQLSRCVENQCVLSQSSVTAEGVLGKEDQMFVNHFTQECKGPLKKDPCKYEEGRTSSHVALSSDSTSCGAEARVSDVDCSDLSIVTVATESQESSRQACIIPNMHCPTVQPPDRLQTHKITPYFFKTLGLNVTIETLPKFQKQYPMYNFACAQTFRRDQYADHFEHVHGDIHGGLNGWILERCPLAQFGCPYIRNRLKPLSKEGSLVFSHDIGSFGVKPVTTSEDVHCSWGLPRHGNEDCGLLSLPPEVLETLISYLDSYTLNSVSRTCKALRDVCQALLRKHGVVVLDWERRTYLDTLTSWRVKRKRWFYTSAFSPISQWHFTDELPMCHHLQHCPFFDRHQRTEKYQLPAVSVVPLQKLE